MKLRLSTFAILTAFALLLGLALPCVQAAQVSGAIFTTTASGARVNANLYSSKCEVYLDGGPGPNAPAGAAGLPEGDYFFQVTDASGKHLLSTDIVNNRRFRVANGVIVAYTGVGGLAHPIGYDQDHAELGAITIRLADASCPADYLDSPNGGGVYKVWVTPAEEFVGDVEKVSNDCGNGCYHGFVPSKSKTDNFKAKVGTPTFCLTVWKRVINGETEGPGIEWPITVKDPLNVDNHYFTGAGGFLQVCGLTEGDYTVREATPEDFSTVGLSVNGVEQSPQPVYSFFWSPGRPEPVIVFRNKFGVAPEEPEEPWD